MHYRLITTAVLAAALASAATYFVTRADSPAAAGPQTRDETETPGVAGAPALPPRSRMPIDEAAVMGNVAGSAFADDGLDAQRQDAQRAALSQAFAREPVDAAWSSATERHLSQTMASNIMVDTEIVPDQLDVECRKSLCLVKARFGKYNDAADWGLMLVTAAGSAFGKAMPTVTPGPDGKAYLEMYAQRP
jgi:hypothetical protein